MVKKKSVEKLKKGGKRKKKSFREDLEKNESGSVGSILLTVILLFILIGVLIILVYMLYVNIPGEPEYGTVVELDGLIADSPVLEVRQFFPNTKFNHNLITYKIDATCSDDKKERMLEAFSIVSQETKLINFKETLSKPDIDVSCSEEDVHEIEEEYFIAGEGGAKEIIQTGRFNVITEGIILLFDAQNSKTAKCDYPNIELHELMHVFGFDHSEDKKSLMNPYLEFCEQTLDKSIIDELKRLYSIENFSDLYFENIKAIKNGRYLDFNLTIKNSGVANAENVKFSVFDNGELVQTREIDGIPYGAGVSIEVKNFKLINRNSKDVEFVIDYEKIIKEIDEENNNAVIRFES